jgi:2-oxoglutarate dehydrogenase E2 component (dihydrolipoamide succinyltransferase)
MTIEIKVPSVGESITKGTIRWQKKVGDPVREGETICQIETDKATMDVPATVSGTLRKQHVAEGAEANVGAPLCAIEPGAVAAAAPVETPKPVASTTSVRKSPDEFFVEKPKPVQKDHTTREKMSKVRKTIAKRLVEVKNQTAMLTTFNEVDMSAIMAVREKEQENFQKKHGIKLGFMSFFVKGCVAALQEFPRINAYIEEDEIVYHKEIHIGIAVGTDRGLFVPVIRNADRLSYADIEKQLKEYAEKAKTGKITIDEMSGGTFTITNGGVYGSLLSTPILNPPQSGILGMHNIVKRPVAIDDQVVIRPMMYLALSYDHRIVDGKESVSFLVHIKKNLEDPARLLLDL